MKTSFYSRCGLLALLSLFVGVATAADNVIVPGVRCGAFILGKTTEKELSAIPKTKELDFQFSRDGILDSGRRDIP